MADNDFDEDIMSYNRLFVSEIDDDTLNCELDNLFNVKYSDYILESDMSQFFNSCPDMSNNSLDLIHFNIRSMNANLSHVSNLLSMTSCKPSVLALSETWLDDY